MVKKCLCWEIIYLLWITIIEYMNKEFAVPCQVNVIGGNYRINYRIVLDKSVRILVFAFIALALIPGTVKSQSFIGLKAGANATSISYNNEIYKEYYNPKIKPGYTGGLVLLMEHKEKFGLYTEVLYSAKGKYVESSANDYETNIATLNYIDFPVLFRARINKQKFSWFFHLGPEFNYWLGGKGEFKVYEPDRNVYTIYDYKINLDEPVFTSDYLNVQDANRLQISLAFGTGMLWKLENANYLALDLRFSMGHTFLGGYRTASIPNIGIVDNFEYTNNVLSASLVYYVDILEKIKQSKNKYRRR